jgi:integrase
MSNRNLRLLNEVNKSEMAKTILQTIRPTTKNPNRRKTQHANIKRIPPNGIIPINVKRLRKRPIELTWLKIKDINLQNGITHITGAKHTVGRIGKLKPNTIQMLKQYINKKDLNQDDRIFPTQSRYIGTCYRHLRNALAKKLQDPTIQQIRLYDFRHFYATMEYHKTKDLLHVKARLGHKDLRTTLRYTQLIETLENDEYHCKTATNIKEATQLIENGFEYVTEIDGTKLFRKRK